MNTQTGAEAQHVVDWRDVWIAIPAYQEETTIRAIVDAALRETSNVIVVNDGSTDGTLEKLKGLPVSLLSHETNRGKAASLQAAFSHALERGAVGVITLDGDGQHDPEDAALLLAAWRRHPDRILIGSRLHDRSQFPVARWRANRFACFWISWASSHPIADSQSGFRLYPAEVMQVALSRRVRGNRFTFESEILIEASRSGYQTLAVAIPGRYPVNARASHFRPVWDITKIVIMVGGRLLRTAMNPLGLWKSLSPAMVLPGRDVASTDEDEVTAGPEHKAAA